MNHYEAQVIKLQKRIARIETDPDKRKLNSNRLRYELQLEEAKNQIEALKAGKPFSDGGGFTASALTKAMGFTAAGSSTAVFAIDEAKKYLDLARSRGWPVDNSCDMTSVPFAVVEFGDVPNEDLFVCDQHACTPMNLSGIFLSYTQKRASYYIDLGFEENEANLRYVTGQLEEFIAYCEKNFPGIKYDESKLIELQEIEETIQGINREIYQMRKHKPSPIAGKDAFANFGVGLSPKAIEYAKMRRDEIAERIEKGLAGVPDEKLRVIWTVTRPFFMDPFEVLAKHKVAVILHYSGPVASQLALPQKQYWGERKLKPLEKIAARAISSFWAGPGHRWVDNLVWISKDLQADAIINYCMLGCSATLGLKRLVENKVQKELGIPILQLEGSQWNEDYADKATITAQLDEFAQMCLGMKDLS